MGHAINVTLVFSALMLGLASGGHCIAMCGAGSAFCVGSSAGASSAGSTLQRISSFHLGRVFGYAFIGALLGGAAAAFNTLTQWVLVLRPLWTMANAALFLLGAALLITARQPAALNIAGQWLGRRLRPARDVTTVAFYAGPSAALAGAGAPIAGAQVGAQRFARRALAVGLGWAFIPCGPLYSAWTLTLFAGNPASGALTGAAFALASGAQLALAQWWFVHRSGRTRAATGGRWDSLGMRVAGAALCLSAAYSIAMLASGGSLPKWMCL